MKLEERIEKLEVELQRLSERKVILEFDNREDAKVAMDGWKYKYVIDEIWNDMLRPNNKNGYNNPILDSDSAYDVIEELIKIYLETTEEVR